MRRAISALLALGMAILSALLVRWTNGVPVLMGLFLMLCPVVCVSDEPEPYPAGGVLRVMARQQFAHGCPVSPDVLLSALHVTNAAGRKVAWGDASGNEGRASVLRSDESRDLVVLHVTTGKLAVSFPIAKQAPAVGDRVYVVGYSFASGDPVKVNLVGSKVVSLSAGHMFYSKSPGPGSSGACVLNERREVVAVNVGLIELSGVGIGVSVWGQWAPSLEITEETE